jgi:cell division protein FtsL
VPRQPAAVPARRVAARPSALARAAALPDHRLIDRLLRGRLWICFIALALGGIVAMQVSLLKLNTGISRAVQTSATLEMQNASLQAGIARLSSQERIQREVTALGMQIPEAGDVEHVRVRGRRDGERAARRMTEPSAQAREVLAAAGALSAQTGMGAAQVTGAPTGATVPATPTVPTTPTVPAASTAPTTGVGAAPAAPAGAGFVGSAPAVPATPSAAAQVAGAPQG